MNAVYVEEPHMTGKLNILNETGDTLVTWDVADQETIDAACAEFAAAIERTGGMAYRNDVVDGVAQREQIRTFDPTAAQIVIVPARQGG